MAQEEMNQQETEENTIETAIVATNETYYSCNVCNYKFKRRYDMLRHIRKNHEERTVAHQQASSSEFCKESDLLQKQDQHSKIDIFLNTSEYATDTSTTASTMKSCCTICGYNFKRRSDMLRHMRRTHAGGKLSLRQQKSTLFCEFCNKGFTRTTSLAAHKEKNHKDMTVMNSSLSCDECAIMFTKKLDLNKHLKEEHQRPLKHFRRNRKEIVASHFCDVCNKGFTRKYDMNKHRKLKHPETESMAETLTQRQKNNVILLQQTKISGNGDNDCYKCESCGKVFTRSCYLLRHQTIHTDIRAFSCHICGKGFRMAAGLTRHIRTLHDGERRFVCAVCQKPFAAKASLEDHMNIHADRRPFVCDVCGKAFRHKGSLFTHKLFHANSSLRYPCSVCGKRFRRTADLRIHSWLHTGHKPYQCNVCNMTFRRSQDMQRHSAVHTNNRYSHGCKICGSTFKQKRYLNNHMKTHMG